MYEYEKGHTQQLLYVALSRVTSIEGLSIVTSDNNKTFYYGRKSSKSTDLDLEFKRLNDKHLRTIDKILLKLINGHMSIYTFNCQSLRAHSTDFKDSVFRECSFLFPSETYINNEDKIDIPNFQCIVQYKRSQVRNGGVAIYSNIKNNFHSKANTVLNLIQKNTTVGDLCGAICEIPNGQKIALISIFFARKYNSRYYCFCSRNIVHIHVRLHKYNGPNSMPMILGEDFNINFSKAESQPFIEFLKLNF